MRPMHEDEGVLYSEPFKNEKTRGMKVNLEHVSFKYPTRDVAVLDDLNLEVR